MFSTRKSIIAIATLCLIVVLSACSSGGGKGNVASPSAKSGTDSEHDNNVELSIMWWGGQSRNDATLRAIDIYKKKNPGITFEPSYMGDDTYFTKLATLAAAKMLPDIMQLDAATIIDYASRGLLADLTGSINLDHVSPSLASAGVIQGKLYGIPTGQNLVVMAYNKSVLEKLGISVPEKGFSWDEWSAKAREIKPKLDKDKYIFYDFSYGVGPATSFYSYYGYQLSAGKGPIYTDDGEFAIDRDTFIAFHNLFSDFRKEGIVPPVDVTASHKLYDPKFDLFFNGTVLTAHSSVSAFPTFDAANPGSFSLTPYPTIEASSTYLIPSQYYVINSESKNFEAAAKFVDFLINDLDAGKELVFQRGIPISSTVLESLDPILGPLEKLQTEVLNKFTADSPLFPNSPKGFGSWAAEYNKISQNIAIEKLTPEQGYEQLKKAWSELVQ